MAEPVNRMVIDLSHWNTVGDWNAIKAAGIVGVIHKATQGTGYADPDYAGRRQAAIDAGLLWGAYHFGDSSDVDAQVDWFLKCAKPDGNTLLALDWEDNPGAGGTMTTEEARAFLKRLEEIIGERPVLYAGNKAKDALGSTVDPFFGGCRLWLAQYGSSPTVQASWGAYWLWQYSDGSHGPEPRNCPGVDGACDTNSFRSGSASQLAYEWTGREIAPAPEPPEPGPAPEPQAITISIRITVPPGASVTIATQ